MNNDRSGVYVADVSIPARTTTDVSSDFSSWACRLLSSSRRVISLPFCQGEWLLCPRRLPMMSLCVTCLPLGCASRECIEFKIRSLKSASAIASPRVASYSQVPSLMRSGVGMDKIVLASFRWRKRRLLWLRRFHFFLKRFLRHSR